MPPKKRRSSLLILAGASLALMALPASWSRPARLTVMAGLIPFQRLAHRAAGLLPGGSGRGENQELRTQLDYHQDQVARLKEENARLQRQIEEISTLRKQKLFPDDEAVILTAGVVVPSDSSPWRKSLVLDLGSRGGVRKGMLVLYQNQLVGRVIGTGPLTSLVQIVTDPAFKAGAVAAPKTYTAGVSFEERRLGKYEGTAGDKGRLSWLTGDTTVETGSLVLTTADPVNDVPRGLVLGRVAGVTGAHTAFPRVDVEPLVNFRGLSQVTLLGRREEVR